MFHQVHASVEGTFPMAGYSNDLNIVAAGLSRLCTIYTLIDQEEGLIPLPIDLCSQSFANGAAELRGISDGFFFSPLLIVRADVVSTLPLIKRAGVALTCDLYPIARRGQQHGDADP